VNERSEDNPFDVTNSLRDGLLCGEQMLDPLQFLRKLEAKLVRFIVRQPTCHLREYDLMVAVRSAVPGRFVQGSLGDRQNCPKLQPNLFRVNLRRIGTRVLEAKAKLLLAK
jgi:hypothetical protein